MESQNEYIGFVGCYTKAGQADPFEGSHGGVPHDRSKIGTGVLAIAVNASSGSLSFLNDGEPIIKADELPNPSYLCILERDSNSSASNNSSSSSSSSRPAALRNGGLCIVSELEKGTFHSYAVCRDKTTMKITAKSAGTPLDTGGSYPCHIISADVGSDAECILVCNYGEEEGALSAFSAAAADSSSESRSKDEDDDSQKYYYTRQICIPFGPGSNADPERQQSSHAHSACIATPPFPYSMMDLCCADLGSDAIVQYSINTTVSITDSSTSTLQCIEKRRLAAPPGSGPRSLMFNPTIHNIAIVSLEMTAQVWLIQRLKDGSFEGCGDPISILPEQWPDDDEESAKEKKQFNGGRWASDAVWSPDGKYVYAAARLHNSISVFKYIVESGSGGGRLELVQRVPTEGLTPRCLCMSECGKCLLVAHQHSHDISSFRREEGDGTIVFADRLEVPNAACVKLVRPELIG